MSPRAAGRPALGQSAWSEYAKVSRNEVMRRIAIAAEAQGLSMVRFAQLAGRARETIVNAFDAKKRPHLSTIDACCDALKFDAIARRALLDEMTARDVSVVRRYIAQAGLVEKLDDLASVPEPKIRQAARAFVLAKNKLSDERDEYAAFLNVVAAGNDGVFARALRKQAAYPKRVLDCLDLIHQRVPAAASFTVVDDNLALAVLDRYVSAKEPADEWADASQMPELMRIKDVLGAAAAKAAAGKPLPRFSPREKRKPK